MNNKLKTILITLIVILISGVSFGGIYVKNLNAYANIMKDYMLARNLKGSRVVELKVVEEAAEEEKTTEGEVFEEEVNNEQVVEETKIATEDLKVAKKILKERLKKLGSEDYVIEQNSETGDTTIYLNEDDLTDFIVAYSTKVGEFKIVAVDDENNILMNNEHIKNAKVGYDIDGSEMTVYLGIEFNKQGKQKLEEINGIDVNMETEEYVNQIENEVASENVDIDEKEDNTIESKIISMIDGEEFDEEISNDMLKISIGSSANTMEVQGYLSEATTIAVLLNSGKMPIEYTIEKNEYVSGDMAQTIQIAIMVLTGLALISCIALIIKFRLKGLKVSIAFIGMIAIFLLLVRYTNVYIAMESSIAFALLIIINAYLNWLVLKNNQENTILPAILSAYKKSAKITIPLLIIAVVLCFIRWIPISSIGMLLFWGLISIVITSFAITLPLLKDKK